MELSTSSSEQKKRLEYIDVLELIAIFLIVFSHGSVYDGDILNNNSAICYVRYYLSSLIAASVPMFFFVNGYLLFGREFNLKKHLHKTLRLTLITIAWAIISALVIMLIKAEPLTVKTYLVKVWGMNGNWLWYMGMLICIYIFFPILKSAYDHNEKAFMFFVIICAVMTFGNRLICNALTIAANILIDYPKLIKTNVFNAFNPFQGIYWYDFVYFCGGGLMWKYVPQIQKKLKQYTAVAAIAVPLMMLLLTAWCVYLSKLSGELQDPPWTGFDTVFDLVMVPAIFVICLNYNPKRNAVKKAVGVVSRNTLGIYFVHELYIYATKGMIRGVPAFSNIPMNVLYAIAIIAVSLLTVWIIKKIPILRKLLV